MGKWQPLQHLLLTKLDSYMQENETGLLSTSICKSKLKMHQRPECKSWNHQTLRKTYRQKSLGHKLEWLPRARKTKANSKWIKELNVSDETIKLLEKKHRQKSLGHKHEQLLHEHISPGKGNKSKNVQVGHVKLKSFCTAKNTISRTKRHPTVWRIYS